MSWSSRSSISDLENTGRTRSLEALNSERQGRVIDHDKTGSRQKKREGIFETRRMAELRAFGKKGSGTVAGTAQRVLRTTVPDPFFPNALSDGGESVTQHCCDAMRRAIEFVCDQHSDRFDCPDCLIHFSSKFGEYGLIVHDGGSSSVAIRFCPWCGSELRERIKLSEKDSQLVSDLLANPPPANAKLRKAARDLLDRS